MIVEGVIPIADKKTYEENVIITNQKTYNLTDFFIYANLIEK
jgi:hypothetical protein